MSTDWYIYCTKCRRYLHLGQRSGGADYVTFGYSGNDLEGRKVVGQFVYDHGGLDHDLHVAFDAPDDYEDEEELGRWVEGAGRVYTVKEWNDWFAVGQTVQYFPVRGQEHTDTTTTTGLAWSVGDGSAVVHLKNKLGAVRLSHLLPICTPKD